MSGAIRRTSRSAPRPDARGTRRTERDLWLLEVLAKMRFLTTTQLARLAFEGSRWATNKRCRKLLDAGLVRAWVRDLAQENVYSLTRRGATQLAEAEEPLGGLTVPCGLDGNLGHLLAINDVRIALALGLPEAGGELIWWRSDWEFPRRGRSGLVPDALFALRWDSKTEQVFALEVDNRSNSCRAFLKKILRSIALRQRGFCGVSDFLTLIVVRDPQWMERYRLALGHIRLRPRVWFTTCEAFDGKAVCSPMWKAAGGDENYSLRDLNSLPYGKEGSDSPKGVFSGSYDLPAARI